MKTITYAETSKAVREQCPNGMYYMSLTGEAAQCVFDAVNQGIDSHLEACFCPDRGDKYHWDTRKAGKLVICRCLVCSVSPDSLPVLLRRLNEADPEESVRLAADIMGTLEFDVETCGFEIISPVDEPEEVTP